MTDIVKGMARAYFETHFTDGWSYAEMEEKVPGHNADMEHSMRAALMWLADQFETNKALRTSIKIQEAPGAFSIKIGIEDDIAAAIRAAAGEEGE